MKEDAFVADKNYYQHRDVAHNDLIVLRRKDYLTVKRVIAIGGDTIRGEDRRILLNGQALEERAIRHTLSPGSNPEQDTFGPVAVPVGKYFVMGDNRDVSLDSRALDFGLIDAKAITGKPLYIYRSPTRGRTGQKLH